MTLSMGQIAAPPNDLGSIDTLEARIATRQATVGVVGLGYVGLPLAIEFAKNYRQAVGFDMNAERVADINRGRSHIVDVSDSAIEEVRLGERFVCTTDFADLKRCDVIVICVPTPLEKTKNPDLSYVRGAAQNIAEILRPGQLVVLESTTYPGTTEELLLPLFARTGLELDRDFLLAFSPERVDPGSGHALRDIPKVVGGCTARSTDAATDLYRAIVVSVHPVSSARVAETVKLLENTFRLVNIGLVNEFALLCRHLGIDTGEVIAAASTKPFGFMPFQPGPGVGGHCIPLDPLYLTWKAEQHGFISRFIDLADRVNSEMPARVVEMIADALNARCKAVKDSRVLVIGVAYKPNVDDMRQSPATAVIDRLRTRGAYVAYHDPLVPVLNFDFHDSPEWRPRTQVTKERRMLRTAGEHAGSRRRRYDALHSLELTPELIEGADCVAILTDHRDVDYGLIAKHADVVIDTRNAITREQRAHARAEVIHL